MLWSALRLPSTDDPPSPTDAALQALAVWALQFTPRVAVAEEAVLLEVAASLRLFGGRAALRERLWGGAQELGAVALAWAPNALAALALARAGVEDGLSVPLERVLDALPMTTLSAVRPHQPILARTGCRTLGDLRRLPRAGLARRFDADLLAALDQAYGHAPETHVWIALPAVFDARLELPHRIDNAEALVFGARRLLLQLAAWLSARHSGVTAFTLHWAHDAMRSRGVGEGGQLTVRTAEPTREVGHLARLLAEHLSHVVLAAAVGDLRLTAEGVVPLAPQSASWLPDEARGREPLPQVLERLAARLGEDRVVRPVLCEDHRPEAMECWQPAARALPREAWPAASAGPQPALLLA
jgi:protein ImuB